MKFSLPKIKFPKLNQEILSIVLLFLAWRGALFLVAYFGYFSIIPASGSILIPNLIPNLHPMISMWLVYDYGWFMNIAAHGYGFSRHAMAFFPLWPVAIWLFNHIFYYINTHIIAFILANLITLLDCWVFYKLVLIDYDKDTAYRAVKYFLFFPMSLFLASAYSEPLFLLGVLSSFYFIRQKQYVLSGLGGIIASGTRLVGGIVLLPLVIEVIKQKVTRKNWWKIPAILIAPLGLLGYMYFLKTHYGDGIGFLHAYQNSDWQRAYGYDAFQLFWKDIQTLYSFQGFRPNKIYFDAMMTTGSVLLMTIVLILNIRKIRLSYFVYAIGIMLVPLFSDSLTSLNRYVLPVFPFFMVLGVLGKRKWVDDLITVTFLVLLGLFTVMFINRWWVG